MSQRGQISATDSMDTCLEEVRDYYHTQWYSSIAALLRTSDFKEHVLAQLPSESPAVLHVDFGCGPATVSAAIMDALPQGARLTTIGHDHNEHMVKKAKQMIGKKDLEGALSFYYHHDWDNFQREVELHTKQKWDAIWITANFLFGQESFGEDDASKIAEIVNSIRISALPATRLFMFGMHPNYRSPGGTWRSIAKQTGANDLAYIRIFVAMRVKLGHMYEVSPPGRQG